jgi:pimeloyl-ACP methyl ester carboxylesterase
MVQVLSWCHRWTQPEFRALGIDMPTTGYASVNGLPIYYEIYGSGQPLILLHGGVVGIVMFGPVLELLSKGRQVVAIELQGHGRTADADRPLAYETLADDVAGVMQDLGITRADIVGVSFGGGVALHVAFRHPALVRKLVVVAAAFRQTGWYPEVRAGFERLGPATGEMMKHSPLAKLYPSVDWATLFAKIGALQRSNYDWGKDVAAIKAPTMLVFADADAIQPTHIVEFYELLGGGKRDAGLDGSQRSSAQLAILPGLTHYTISAAPALADTVAGFLDR